ncbi:hypothetical protein K523DRAFT_323424 [Schizophyllum commune Tattone D]|nr:hypothetical protein K523DRAFT_323424 [Schizophyllum commune Tattone D]
MQHSFPARAIAVTLAVKDEFRRSCRSSRRLRQVNQYSGYTTGQVTARGEPPRVSIEPPYTTVTFPYSARRA